MKFDEASPAERALLLLESAAVTVRVLMKHEMPESIRFGMVDDIYDELLRIEQLVTTAFCPRPEGEPI